MGRDISPHGATSTLGYIGAKQLPPCEETDIPRVPLSVNSAPPLSRAEFDALSSLRASRAALDHQSPDMDQRFPDSACKAASPASRTDVGSSSATKLSTTDSARAISPQPGDHRHMVPAHGHEAIPSSSRQPVVALPGTMSSRSNLHQHHTTSFKRPANKRQHKKGSQEPVPIGHRFTSAVKELFQREPIDESNFECIGNRHWAED